MSNNRAAMTVVLAMLCLAPAPVQRTYTGVVTDSMCKGNHAAMKMGPDDACARACVGDGQTYRFVLLDGKNTYVLSDQAAPAKFAGRKVLVTGQLYEKTGVLRVDRIEPVR
jgi:hypothetical protein